MNIDKKPDDARSGIANENIQEVLDAAVSAKHATQGGQQQYQTPEWLARGLAALLPFQHRIGNALDPQCAGGNLLSALTGCMYQAGVDLDKRFAKSEQEEQVHRITASCVDVFAIADDMYPDLKFDCIVTNPPFGIRWKLKGDETIDSTEWTWQLIEKRLAECGCGFIISNANTIERLKIHEHKWSYLYQRFPAGGVWEDCNVELGIVHFYHHQQYATQHDERGCKVKVWPHVPSEEELKAVAREFDFFGYYRPWGGHIAADWSTLTKVVAEEAKDTLPKWNIYLDKDGMLRTYLSTRSQVKIRREEIQKLARINRCHPLTLTTERETRKLMHEFLTSGIYTIQPEARQAIVDALAEVVSMACPIRPVTDFELVAYADEEDTLECIALPPPDCKVYLTVGKKYEVTTGTYTFQERYTRKKLHFDEKTEETTISEHDCVLSGEDRYIQIVDDRLRRHHFMDRPERNNVWQHPEDLLWKLFKRPYVPTISEVQGDKYAANLNSLRFNELIAGITYYPGQLDYIARMACKDHGLIAADVGTGKTPMALALIAVKAPKRALIIAPQGTMRSSGDEDEIDYEASQWVKEIQKFSPGEPVFQLFSREDWRNILHANGGELPPGIYITYPQAYFSNGAFEHIPDSWERKEEQKFCEEFNLHFDEKRKLDDCFHRHVGAHNKHGIRCVATPSLATLIATKHGEPWDMVCLDEAHLYCNLGAFITNKLLRLQPKYRYSLTATPIPNIVTNIFSLMGWLCVKDWYKGERRNAAWPYAVDEIGRFASTFLSEETDITAQDQARRQGKKGWRKVGVRTSPIISAPARLLKLLKPNMAYISKEECNPQLQPCEVIDVRVQLGKEQSVLYKYWLNRANYLLEYKNPLTIARVQSTRLRGICASPASLDYTRGMCKSNFNHKTTTILELIRQCLAKGEQVVVVSARVDQSDALATRLAQAVVPIARIDSTVSAELHTAEANRFKKGEARVMLMGIKCAQGHSFEQCPNLIIGSLEWSYGTLHQAKGRVWRLTSPKPVKIWCVLHKGSIEELLFDRVALKQDAATLCLHGKRVPRDFKTMDPAEILAEHIVNFETKDGDVLSETESEEQWPDLRKKLVISNRVNRRADVIEGDFAA